MSEALRTPTTVEMRQIQCSNRYLPFSAHSSAGASPDAEAKIQVYGALSHALIRASPTLSESARNALDCSKCTKRPEA